MIKVFLFTGKIERIKMLICGKESDAKTIYIHIQGTRVTICKGARMRPHELESHSNVEIKNSFLNICIYNINIENFSKTSFFPNSIF